MKRRVMLIGAALALLFVGGIVSAYAQTESKIPSQASFQIPFPFQAGGKKFVAGAYAIAKAADSGLILRQVSSGKETPVQLVFDEVGDFAPSYTEYITVYVLSEVWLAGEDGYRVHVTKGAHKTRVVKAGAVLPLSEPH
jgi:hypothetical protein